MRYQFGSFVLDTEARLLSNEGGPLHLSGKAFDLLRLLIDERPRAINKQELYDRLWPDTFVADGSLPVLVREIRVVLGASGDLIRTIHRIGYAFGGAVEDAGRTPASDVPTAVHQLMYADQRIRLTRGRNIVGRDASADVFVPSASVSRQHAAIVIDDGGATVEDLQSKNGTRVDGLRVTGPTRLPSGCLVSFGAVEFVYACIDPTMETHTLA